jgi:hypothetical protein
VPVRPDEDRDVIVQFVADVTADTGEHHELWAVWCAGVELCECVTRETAIDTGRTEAELRGVRAWLLDAHGYPLQPI